MSADLHALSDAQLSEVFAVEVANIPPLFTLMKRGLYYRDNAHGYTSELEQAWKIPEGVADQHACPLGEPVTKHRLPYPPFATSADAILPFIEAEPMLEISRPSILHHNQRHPRLWWVQAVNRGGCRHQSLARAICTALINIKRCDMATDRARHRSEHPLGTDSV